MPALVATTVPKLFAGFVIVTLPAPASTVTVPATALTAPFATTSEFVVAG